VASRLVESLHQPALGGETAPIKRSAVYLALLSRSFWGCCAAQRGASPLATGISTNPVVRVQPLVVIAHSLFQLIRVLVNLIDRRNRVSGLIFFLVEYPEVLLTAIEVKAADGLAVIVVQ